MNRPERRLVVSQHSFVCFSSSSLSFFLLYRFSSFFVFLIQIVMRWDALHWAAFKGDNKMVSDIIQHRKKGTPQSELQQQGSF